MGCNWSEVDLGKGHSQLKPSALRYSSDEEDSDEADPFHKSGHILLFKLCTDDVQGVY